MREVIRCEHCALNQFMTLSGKCRKCHKFFVAPEPELLVVEVVRPVPGPRVTLPLHVRMQAVVRTVRMALELSHGDLAKTMNTTRQAICRYERSDQNKDMTVDLLNRFSVALGVSSFVLVSLAEAAQ